MLKRLIIFLIRLKLGLKKMERFKFDNQASKKNYYFFDKDVLIKVDLENNKVKPSTCSLNWLLCDNCVITRAPFEVDA